MDVTAFDVKYMAHELTRHHASDSVEKLAAALSDAQVDLNPHQIEAALFAFRNPFSKGANLPEKLERQRALRQLETKRTEAWKAYDVSSREIEQQKDAVLDEVSRRMQQRTESATLFTLRWRID